MKRCVRQQNFHTAEHNVVLKNCTCCGSIYFHLFLGMVTGAPNDNFRKNICSEDNLRSRIFGRFVVKFAGLSEDFA